MTAPAGYSRTQIRLHWIIAALIALQYIFHETIAQAWSALERGKDFAFDPLIAQHVFTGLLVLGLVGWRLVIRVRRGVPDLPAQEPAPLKIAAHVTHWAFYALMILMPLSGAAAWFAGAEDGAAIHNVLKAPLILLIVLHFAAALFHHFVLKTGLMKRMKTSDLSE